MSTRVLKHLIPPLLASTIFALLFALPTIGVYYFLLAYVAMLCIYSLLPLKFDFPRQPYSIIDVTICMVAVGAACLFRLAWLPTAPPSYGSETLNFVVSASNFLRNGFSYVPYDWYAHNLYAYAIAVGTLFTNDILLGLKVAGAILSIVTVIIFLFFMRRVSGPIGVWTSTILFATSFAHAQMSRVGYHQFLIPLFVSLLFLGITMTLQERNRLGPVMAAVGMVGGLHAQWGFYVYPVILLLWLGSLFTFDRPLLRCRKVEIIVSALLTVGLALPLIIFFFSRLAAFEYLFSWFNSHGTGRWSLLEKYDANLQELIWGLSGLPLAAAKASGGPYLDELSSGLFLGGLILICAELKKPLYRLIAIAVLMNAVGLIVTKSGTFWFMAMVVPVYSCIGICAEAVVHSVSQMVGRALKPLVILAAVSILLFQGAKNFETFRDVRLEQFMCLAGANSAGLFSMTDAIKEDVANATVYVPYGIQHRGLGTQLQRASQDIVGYEFLDSVMHFADMPFFAVDGGGSSAVVLYYPLGNFTERLLRPVLTRLYPGMQWRTLVPPPPYYPKSGDKLAERFQISPEDISERSGLSRDGYGKNTRWRGIFMAPRDVAYTFRAAALPQRVSINGEFINFQADQRGYYASSPVFLEHGLHPVDISAQSVEDWEYTDDSAAWKQFLPDTFNWGGGDIEPFLVPFLRPTSQTKNFHYVVIRNTEDPTLRRPILGTVRGEGGTVWVVTREELLEVGDDDAVVNRIPYPSPAETFFGITGGAVLLIGHQGSVSIIESNAPKQISDLECFPLAVDSGEHSVAVLCREPENSGYWIKNLNPGGMVISEVKVAMRPHTNFRMTNFNLLSFGNEYLVADAELSLLSSVDMRGAVRWSRTMPQPFIDLALWSTMQRSQDGLFFLNVINRGVLLFGRNGGLLFAGRRGEPDFFLNSDGSRFNSNTCHMQLFENGAIALCEDGRMVRFEKREG